MGGQNSKSSINGSSGIDNTVNFIHSSGEIESNSAVVKKEDIKDSDVWQTFTWSYGGNQVLLTGSFYKWKQTRALQKQGDEFSITIVKIFSDSNSLEDSISQHFEMQWRFSPEDPIIPDANGNINNVVDTTNFKKIMDKKQKNETGGKEENTDKETPYQGVQQFAKYAPKLPPHYESCSFLKSQKYNSNKTFPNGGQQALQMQDQNQKFEQSLTEAQIQQLFNSPHCLPPPYHVQVDHLIRQINKNYSSYCITQRFKNKYTTYKYFLTGREGEV